MKRLTDKRLALPPGVWQEVTDEQRMEMQEIPVPSRQELYYRLFEIEEILCDGEDEYDLDRLRGLVEADREGKVPKYTCGDTIYDRFGDEWEVDSAEFHRLKRNENPKWIYRCGHIGTDDYCALWEFEVFPSREAALKAREQDE